MSFLLNKLRLERVMDIQNISKLMKKHWDGQIPVDVRKIAKSMNIELIPMNFDDSYKSKIKTKITDDGSKKTITYSTKGNKHIQNILITHAIARIALNQVKVGEVFEDADNFDLVKYKNSDDLEANMATYQILIPTNDLKKTIKHYSTWDPEEIAGIFDTNIELTYRRMKDLGLVEA